MCDNRADCGDASDECPCSSFQSCISNFPGSEVCGVRRSNCSFNSSAQHKVIQEIRQITKNGRIYENKSALNEAIARNPKFRFQLSRVTGTMTANGIPTNTNSLVFNNIFKVKGPSYNCTDSTFIELYRLIPNSKVDGLYQVICNGERNCIDGIDEQHCPHLFYCKSDSKPIPKEMVCDRVPHCADSSDECQDCPGHGLSSKENIISSKGLEFAIVFQIVLILCLNGYACRFQYQRNVNKPKIRIDQILCFNLIFYDLLMATYLLIITWKQLEYSGAFCEHETDWRASNLCQISGFLFFFSTNGALQVVFLTSISRVFGVKDSFSDGSKKAKQFAVLLGVMNVANLVLSLLPIISTKVDSPLTDMFLYEHFLTNNPFIAKGNKADLAFVLSAYMNITFQEKNFHNNSTSQILSKLRSLFEKGSIFTPKNIKSIGYYGKSSMCIPDLFSNRPELFKFKVAIIMTVVLEMFAIGFCYLLILRHFKKSSLEVNEALVSSDHLFFLSAKVYILITAQILSWVPNVIAMMYSLAGGKVPDMFDEVVIAVISPAYSVLNPCLHTDIFKRVVTFWRGVVMAWCSRNGGNYQPREDQLTIKDDGLVMVSLQMEDLQMMKNVEIDDGIRSPNVVEKDDNVRTSPSDIQEIKNDE